MRTVKITSLLSLFLFAICLCAPNTLWANPNEKTAPTTETKPSEQKSDAGKVNINTAAQSELQTLKGIGKKRAEQIVKDREVNGPFKSAQDLTRIKGIGPKTVEKNLAIITVGAPVKSDQPSDSND